MRRNNMPPLLRLLQLSPHTITIVLRNGRRSLPNFQGGIRAEATIPPVLCARLTPHQTMISLEISLKKVASI
jgi:hypothetical protein